MKCILVLIGLCAISLAAPPKNIINEVTTRAGEEYRLNSNVFPIKYSINLKPYFENEGDRSFTFDGKVEMSFSTSEDNVREITLHVNDLEISEDRIALATDPEGNITIVGRSDFDPDTHKYTLLLEAPLQKDTTYVYYATYIGHMRDDMHGFYRSSYTDNNGITRWIGTTQFQPIHARRVFPCFDEPKYKAVFSVTMNRPRDYNTVTNTNKISESSDGDRVIEVFADTPKMSTYLLAFIVSEFVSNDSTDKKMMVISRAEAKTQTNYALSSGINIIAKFNEYFDYNYYDTIDKMHMAGIPDFSAGAMENWGLLTYRETALLYDESESTSMAQQRVATVIAHEQAHMWFGDLVTCDWWSMTWLNEGFARYFQYFGTAMVETDWGLDYQFVVDQLQVVFGADASETIHALTSDTYTPADISRKFDSISYNKGASIIRMMAHIMGETYFRDVLRSYLKANAFGMATHEKLYTELQKGVNDNEIVVSTFLDKWTLQGGYPVVTAHLNEDGRTVHLEQKRFLLKNFETSTDSTLWDIPITIANSPNPSFTVTRPGQNYMKASNHSITLAQQSDWIIINVQQTGYYRVNYDEKNWKQLESALKNEGHSNIHVLNRAQIVDDILNLARAGIVNYNLAFSVIEYLEDELDYNPWLAAFNNLAYVFRRIENEELINKYIRKLTSKIYNELGFDKKSSDSRLRVYNRVNVMSQNCNNKKTECIESAKKSFEQLQTLASYKVEVDSRSTVYCTAIREGGDSEFDFLWKKFREENVAAEQVLILSSLGCTADKTRIENYIEKILSNDVRLQDKSAAFSATYTNNKANIDIALDYMIANYKKVATAFGNSNSDVASIFSGLAGRFYKQAQIDKLTKFYNDNKNEFTNQASTFTTAIENAEYDLQWSGKHLKTITDYMEEYSSASAIASSLLMILLSAITLTFFNN